MRKVYGLLALAIALTSIGCGSDKTIVSGPGGAATDKPQGPPPPPPIPPEPKDGPK